MQLNKAQILIIAILLAMVGVLVYLNFKTPAINPAELVQTESKTPRVFDLDRYLNGIMDSIPQASASYLANLIHDALVDTGNIYPKLKLARTYDSLGFPLASGYYYQLIAHKLNDENSWYRAGFNFYEAAATASDTAMQEYATAKSIEAFEKVTAINPNNIEAKNALAICYVKGDMDVMKGVQLLKDVLRIDSTNIDANYTLGVLSMRSGQMDKALIRFQTLTRLQPFNAEFYYYLGECYLGLGNKPEAIKAFETFKQLVPDEEAKKSISVTINNLKNQN
jgi:tetratricopeptide (TPR) repeat protein